MKIYTMEKKMSRSRNFELARNYFLHLAATSWSFFQRSYCSTPLTMWMLIPRCTLQGVRETLLFKNSGACTRLIFKLFATIPVTNTSSNLK
jgi:hypothetical protein